MAEYAVGMRYTIYNSFYSCDGLPNRKSISDVFGMTLGDSKYSLCSLDTICSGYAVGMLYERGVISNKVCGEGVLVIALLIHCFDKMSNVICKRI